LIDLLHLKKRKKTVKFFFFQFFFSFVIEKMKAELYERSKLRKVIKGQGKTKKLSSSVDILVCIHF